MISEQSYLWSHASKHIHDERASAKYEAERILAELPTTSEARKPIQIAILRQAVAKVGIDSFSEVDRILIESVLPNKPLT